MPKNRIKIAYVWWGTGWHVFPIAALDSRLVELYPDSDRLWFGEADSLESKAARDRGIPFAPIQSGKFRRYFSWKTFIEPFKILSGFAATLHLLRVARPDAVFSKGGYVSVPVAVAAWCLGIPVLLHESDSVPGWSNHMVARFASTVFLGMESARAYFPSANTVVVGQLLGSELFASRTDMPDADPHRPLETLVIGGSQWSARIYESVLSFVGDFPEVRFTVVLGTKNLGFRDRFAAHSNVTIVDFASQRELGELYARTDIAITRAWATALAEILAFGIHPIVIPLAESANNHQYWNAVWVRDTHGADMIEETSMERDLPVLFRSLSSRRKIRTPYVRSTDSLDTVISAIVSPTETKLR